MNLDHDGNKLNTHPELPFALDAASVAELLGVVASEGLTSDEASARLVREGPNTIGHHKGKSSWQILFAQFKSIIVWLLALAAAVAWFTGSGLESAAILVVLLLNAFIGFAVEWQADRALDALRRRTRLITKVLRNGQTLEIRAAEVVPGDVIALTAGDKVPADARLFETFDLRTDESALTGESLPVAKSADPVRNDTLLAERTSMVYLGTTVVRGHAIAIVTATGANTEFGAVGRLISSAVRDETPLERRLRKLGERLVYLVLVIAAVVLLTGYLRGDSVWIMLEVSISLAVAAVPEGLPAVTTLILALGVLRMAKRNAIVRRLAAVETLGSTTVICTDKTGTLTQNRISVKEIRFADGSGYELKGDGIIGAPLPEKLFIASVLCNEASFDPRKASDQQTLGDPTETALLSAAHTLGFDVVKIRAAHKLILEQPFDPRSRRMTSVWRTTSGEILAVLKGAPGVVLEACVRYLDENGVAEPLTDADRTGFEEINREMAGKALRVLAFAEKTLKSESADEISSEYTFLGFAGMSDPPRPEAAGAIAAAKRAGIRVVMLTGDQVVTARAIASELDLGQGTALNTFHASELKGAEPGQLAEMARQADVFARVSPEDKFKIVRAFQQLGEIVAVTGDGINDAPALKQANIGVAMGERGTEVAKESADIVLTDDNFHTIVKAVEGGRTIYANIIRFVHMMFSHNLGEVLMIFGALVAGLPLPLFPLQILWINLVTDVFPALALAVEPPSENVMIRPPRSAASRILSAPFLTMIAWQGLLLAGIALGAYVWALNVYGEGKHARSVAMLALIGVQLGHLFNCRSRIRSVFTGFFTNPYIFGAAAIVIFLQMIAIYFTPLSEILALTPPNRSDWVVLAVSVVVPVFVVESYKLIVRARLKPL